MQDSAPAPVMMQPAPQPAKGQPVSGVGPI
jgi:hypothetical protein